MVILEVKTGLCDIGHKFNLEASARVWPTSHRINSFTHIVLTEIHSGEEGNCSPFRSLKDFVVGQGSVEPWTHMDEERRPTWMKRREDKE